MHLTDLVSIIFPLSSFILNVKVFQAPEPSISMEQLTMIKGMLGTKHIGQTEFAKILTDLFHHTNYTGLTQTQGTTLINTLSNYVSSTVPAQQ